MLITEDEVLQKRKINPNFLPELRNLKQPQQTWAPPPHSMIFLWSPQSLLKASGCLFSPLLLV